MSIKLIDNIGSGFYGNIYKAQKNDGSFYAVKIVKPSDLRYTELDILTRLRSPYLLRSIRKPIVETEFGKGIVIELKESNLNHLPVDKLSYTQLKRVFMSCLYGLECLHQNGFLHLDIAKDNILYDVEKNGDITAFIGDFGMAVRCSDPYSGVRMGCYIRKIYTPPEIIKAKLENHKSFVYNDKTDVWSLGIVFLSLLGANLQFTNDSDFYKVITDIDEDYIEEVIRKYNNNKLGPKEELELKELLNNMLILDPTERISSKDLKMTAFMKNNSIPDSCMLEKPSEIYYMPYTSPLAKEGIKQIEEYYSTQSKQNLEILFLTIQNYTRLMARSKPDLNEEELNNVVRTSIAISNNYYHMKGGGSFETAEKLDAETGYNPYFYKAKSLDDLIILYDYIKNNEKLLSFYNVINVDDLFDLFRQDYDYSNISKYNISIKEFFEMPMPMKKNKMNVQVMDKDYHNVIPDIEENNDRITDVKKVEKEFREKVYDMISEKMKEEVFMNKSEDINLIYNLLEEKYNYITINNMSTIIKNKSISQELSKIFNFGYIIIDENNILSKNGTEKEYIVVIQDEKASLLYNKNNNITHYYSDINTVIKNYYQDKGYTYNVDYKYGIGKCCMVREPCIIFNIYYNQVMKKHDFSTKCLEKNTIFLIFVWLICQ